MLVDAVQELGPGQAAVLEAAGNGVVDLGDVLGDAVQVEGGRPDLPVLLEATAGLIAARDPATALAQMYFTSPGLRYDPTDTTAQQQIISEQFAGLGWEVPWLLAAMPAASDFYFDTASQVHLDRWSDRRIALIGDAAHAAGPGGNGTGNAVVAAAILAAELAASPGDHQAALARYEQRLRPYVTRAQKQAASSQAFLAPATWKKIHRRNRLYKALPYLPATGFIRRAATRTAAAITLPDYDPAQS